jgi:hypothetical protein
MAEPIVTTEPTTPKRKVHPTRFKTAEHVVREWSVVAEAGTKFEELSNPGYWSHVAKLLSPGNIIHIHTDDCTFYARLYVKDVAPLSARVVPLEHLDLTVVERLEAPEEYEVEWAGPHHKHRIIRKKDRAVIQPGFESREAALAAMASHVRQMAA